MKTREFTDDNGCDAFRQLVWLGLQADDRGGYRQALLQARLQPSRVAEILIIASDGEVAKKFVAGHYTSSQALRQIRRKRRME